MLFVALIQYKCIHMQCSTYMCSAVRRQSARFEIRPGSPLMTVRPASSPSS